MNRRQFFERCGGGTALAALGTPAIAGANDYAPIHFWMKGFNEEEFGEKTMIKKAMNILHTRFRDLDVLRNVYKLSTKGHFLGDGVWDKSNLDDHPTYTRHHLLRYQLETLRLPNDKDDTEPEFPNVHIDAFHEKGNTQARARVGLVNVKYVGNDVSRQSGEFRIELNRFLLGSGTELDTPVEWAAAIAHEMAHNLGHRHEKDDYSDRWQINIFHNSIFCNGEYPGGGDGAAHLH